MQMWFLECDFEYNFPVFKETESSQNQCHSIPPPFHPFAQNLKKQDFQQGRKIYSLLRGISPLILGVRIPLIAMVDTIQLNVMKFDSDL